MEEKSRESELCEVGLQDSQEIRWSPSDRSSWDKLPRLTRQGLSRYLFGISGKSKLRFWLDGLGLMRPLRPRNMELRLLVQRHLKQRDGHSWLFMPCLRAPTRLAAVFATTSNL